MNKIYITENQSKRLFEARMDGFRVDMLASARSFAERLRYCKQMLGTPIGNGSSRIVFQLDDYTVLKLAKNKKGIAQNLEEIMLSENNFLSCITNVFNGSDENNGLWIISEHVLPAKEVDFKKVLGIPFEDVKKFIWAITINNKRGYNKAADDTIHDLYEKYETNDDVMELFNDLHSLREDFDSVVSDLNRVANWGLCMRNGYECMVVLDSGCSEEIFNNFYRRY